MDNVTNLFILEGKSIRDAFRSMDQSQKKFVLVIDKSKNIIGLISDGDIRRAIWKGIPMSTKLNNIMNKNFVHLSDKKDAVSIKQIFKTTKIKQIPIIKNKKLVEVLYEEDIRLSSRNPSAKITNTSVIIMAGGFGKRLDPFTRILPKALVPIGEKPISEIIMNEFQKYGVNNFKLSLNDKAKMIRAYFQDHSLGYDIVFYEESKPLGTAGSLTLIKDEVEKTFFVSNCDIIIKSDYSQIYKFHKNQGNQITIVGSMKHYTIPYGVCEIEDGGSLKSIKEKPEYDFLTNTGFYILERKIIDLIPKNTYFDMTDLIKSVKNKKYRIGVFPISEKSWIDIGQWSEYKRFIKDFSV
tara:strand:- start:382 stop:1440 length:1059 start_codon:yes stop_codon:yes gene_type:complete